MFPGERNTSFWIPSSLLEGIQLFGQGLRNPRVSPCSCPSGARFIPRRRSSDSRALAWDTRLQEEGCSRGRCSLAPPAERAPLSWKLLSPSTAHGSSSVLLTQRQPRGHLPRVPRHDPEETQNPDAVEHGARASWCLQRPDGRHGLLPREAFQSVLHGS